MLIVDDERSIARMQEIALKRLGYHVVAFTNATEALEAFRQKPSGPDIVVTDQTMPKLPGFELAKELLLTKPGLPIILCTGHSDTVKESDARAAGIRAFPEEAD